MSSPIPTQQPTHTLHYSCPSKVNGGKCPDQTASMEKCPHETVEFHPSASMEECPHPAVSESSKKYSCPHMAWCVEGCPHQVARASLKKHLGMKRQQTMD